MTSGFGLTCTAMSSGLLDAVNTATQRDRASSNTWCYKQRAVRFSLMYADSRDDTF